MSPVKTHNIFTKIISTVLTGTFLASGISYAGISPSSNRNLSPIRKIESALPQPDIQQGDTAARNVRDFHSIADSRILEIKPGTGEVIPIGVPSQKDTSQGKNLLRKYHMENEVTFARDSSPVIAEEMARKRNNHYEGICRRARSADVVMVLGPGTLDYSVLIEKCRLCIYVDISRHWLEEAYAKLDDRLKKKVILLQSDCTFSLAQAFAVVKEGENEYYRDSERGLLAFFRYVFPEFAMQLNDEYAGYIPQEKERFIDIIVAEKVYSSAVLEFMDWFSAPINYILLRYLSQKELKSWHRSVSVAMHKMMLARWAGMLKEGGVLYLSDLMAEDKITGHVYRNKPEERWEWGYKPGDPFSLNLGISGFDFSSIGLHVLDTSEDFNKPWKWFAEVRMPGKNSFGEPRWAVRYYMMCAFAFTPATGKKRGFNVTERLRAIGKKMVGAEFDQRVDDVDASDTTFGIVPQEGGADAAAIGITGPSQNTCL